MKWEEGRLGSGYFKLALFISKKFKFDLYILKYPPNSFIPSHKDVVEGSKHFRINLTIWGSYKAFQLYGEPIFQFWRLCMFRPDNVLHQVFEVRSTAYVISFGWLNED